MSLSEKLASALSLRRNLQLLFVPRGDAIPAVTGLRALSMIWVLIQHVQQGLRPIGGTPAGAAFLGHPLLLIGWAGNLAIEVFFVISGYLIGGMLMEERESRGSVDIRSFYIRRALRILPAYVVAMGVNLCVANTVNKAAVWTNLVFINDFLPFREQFMAHCWTLAIEEQFFAASPLLILLLYRARPTMRTPLLVLTFGVACACAVLVVLGEHLELSLRFPDTAKFWHYMDVFYTRPYTRFGSIALGILVARLERDRTSIELLERRKLFAPVGMLVALSAMLYVGLVFPEGRGPSGEKLLLGSFQLALDGYIFATGIAFILLVSRTKHWLGRFTNRILGNRLLHVYAQLSFAMYLLHPVCIEPLYRWLPFDLASPWTSYLRLIAAAFVVATTAGMIVFLLVELPIMHLRPRRRASSAP